MVYFFSNCVASFHIPFAYSVHPKAELLLTAFLWSLHMPGPSPGTDQRGCYKTAGARYIFSYHAWHEIKYDQSRAGASCCFPTLPCK